MGEQHELAKNRGLVQKVFCYNGLVRNRHRKDEEKESHWWKDDFKNLVGKFQIQNHKNQDGEKGKEEK